MNYTVLLDFSLCIFEKILQEYMNLDSVQTVLPRPAARHPPDYNYFNLDLKPDFGLHNIPYF